MDYLRFKTFLSERYEPLDKHMGAYDWGVWVPLDQIQRWEPDKHKFDRSIQDLERAYRKYKDTGDEKYLPQPIRIEQNTGKIKLRSSGRIIDTGNKKFVIEDGHHRHIAAEKAGLKEINAIIRNSRTTGQV